MSHFPPHVAAALAAVALALVAFAGAPPDDTTLSAVEKQLEARPDDVALMSEASSAALESGDRDTALWYAELARITAAGGPDEKTMDRRVKTLRGELGVEPPPLGKSVDAYSKSVFEFARACGRQKYYANAADSLGGLDGSPYERDARAALEKLFKKSTAVEAMLKSGVPVKAEVRSRRSAAEIARLDRRHGEWEEAYEAKGTNYTVRTNMGVEMADTILNAMEQMNSFYRSVFQHKERGGKMTRCEVRVWKTRQEFDEFNPGTGPNVGGFFRPGENSVNTFDPRTWVIGGDSSAGGPTSGPTGRPGSAPDGGSGAPSGDLEELWSTLYHEASHQFTHAIWKTLIPTWLNEGTASYFEGAALLPGGVVETNRIPEQRLLSLVVGLGGRGLLQGNDPGPDPKPSELGSSEGAPTVKDVVLYMQPGSYPGEYYAFGWGLVYFSMNYENEASERIYEPIYKAFMRSYEDSDKRSPLKRFTDFYIDEPGFEGVEEFDDFVRRFRNWIFELARLKLGGPEQADKLLTRAAKQVANGKPAYAAESLRWALRKRPGDPQALLALGRCYEELDNDDAALFMYRELQGVARQAAPEAALTGFDGTSAEALAAATAGMKRVNKTLGTMVEEQVPALIQGALAEADAWAEAGYPRMALQSLALAGDLLGGDGTLAERAAAIRADAGVDIRRTRRLEVVDGLEAWDVFGAEWVATLDGDDVALVHAADSYGEATLLREPPAQYRFEVDVEAPKGDNQPILGLTFASGADGGTKFIRLGSDGRFGILAPDPESGAQRVSTKGFERGPPTKGGRFTLGIEVGPRATRFFVNGEEVGVRELPASAAAGRIGVVTLGRTTFYNPRLTY